jgi:hypothetical protein
MRVTFYVLTFAIGCLGGAGFFFVADSFIDWQSIYATGKEQIQTRTPLEYRHTGTVVSHDEEERMITIAERSTFQVGTTTGQVRFTYDHQTRWSSQEHVFRGDILESRAVHEDENERALPAGTIVNLVRDPSIGNPWRIAEISFMRRTDL